MFAPFVRSLLRLWGAKAKAEYVSWSGLLACFSQILPLFVPGVSLPDSFSLLSIVVVGPGSELETLRSIVVVNGQLQGG